jgi:intraflagellar transport protein 20
MSRTNDNNPNNPNRLISFDELNRIRLLDADQFKQTSELADESSLFISKVNTFSTTVNDLLELLKQESDKIESAKLKAIGQRNRIETETELRNRKQNELQYAIQQQQLLTQREREHHQSLVKIEQEQKALIEKLSRVS